MENLSEGTTFCRLSFMIKEGDLRMKEILRPKTIPDLVSVYIKEQLERGELMPGDRIDEKKLCEAMGVSRTPIREALIQLDKEMILEIFPRRVIRVRKIRTRDIREIYHMVGLLEADAAVRAVDLMTQKHLDTMRFLIRQMEHAFFHENSIQRYLEINLELHNIPLEIDNNQLLIEVVGNLKKRLYSLPRRLQNAKDWITKSVSDHKKLLRAFENKDKKTIVRILKNEHWGSNRLSHLTADED